MVERANRGSKNRKPPVFPTPGELGPAHRTPEHQADLERRWEEFTGQARAKRKRRTLALVALLAVVVGFALALVYALAEDQKQVDKANQLLRELESKGSIK